MNKCSKIVIFGAGNYGKLLLDVLGRDSVECFVDNNPIIHGLEYKGVPIKSVEYLQSNSELEIVVGTYTYFDEIKKQIESCSKALCYSIDQYLIKRKFERESSNKVVLINTHEGTNVGDYLINISEKYFLRKYCHCYSFVEVSAGEFYREREYLKGFISNDHLILISGGGYCGSLWMGYGEDNVRSIINDYPHNRIIILPQTMYFEDSAEGEREKERSIAIYNKHNNLSICLREKQSFNLARTLFDKRIKIGVFPDMAMILDKCSDSFHRENVLLCFRNDKERIIDEDIKDRLIRLLVVRGVGFSYMDMHSDKKMYGDYQMDSVDERLKMVQRSKLVITDRLHCMIMCFISGTPCAFFDNLSKKISGVFEWIQECEYVRMVKNIDDIEEMMNWALLSEISFVYSRKKIDKYFDKLANVVMGLDENVY